MINTPLLSIIIPVYNTNKEYLNECIDSIKKQSYSSIEAIIVNDGSDKDVQLFIEELIRKDNRFILINKENEGVNSAREFGIKYAKGKYSFFVDSDDYIQFDYLSELVDECEKHGLDIALTSFSSVIDGQIYKSTKLNFSSGTGFDLLNYISRNFGWNVWGKVYLTALLKNETIQFPKELKVGEDAFFMVQVLINAKKVKYIERYGYYYRINDFSVMQNMTKEKSLNTLLSLRYILKILSSEKKYEVVLKNFVIIFLCEVFFRNKSLIRDSIFLRYLIAKYYNFYFSIKVIGCRSSLKLFFNILTGYFS